MYKMFEKLKGKLVKVMMMTSYEVSNPDYKVENEIKNYIGILKEITPFMIILDDVKLEGKNESHQSLMLKIGAVESIKEM